MNRLSCYFRCDSCVVVAACLIKKGCQSNSRPDRSRPWGSRNVSSTEGTSFSTLLLMQKKPQIAKRFPHAISTLSSSSTSSSACPVVSQWSNLSPKWLLRTLNTFRKWSYCQCHYCYCWWHWLRMAGKSTLVVSWVRCRCCTRCCSTCVSGSNSTWEVAVAAAWCFHLF